MSQLSDSEYKLILQWQLNRELIDHHTVNIICGDVAQPNIRNTVSLVVRVRDENDNPPYILVPQGDIHLMENNEVGAHVLRAEAYDPDTGLNGKISFSVSLDTDFSINPMT